MSETKDISRLVKDARIEKGYSARELAKMCDISHTEINNIESGNRVKPAILTLKAFEKYLGLDFKKTAKLVGYSNETIEYTDDSIIISYEKFDKKLNEFELEKKELMFKIDQKRHLGMDIKEYFDEIYNYLNSLDNVDINLLKKSEYIYKLLDNIINEIHNTGNEK